MKEAEELLGERLQHVSFAQGLYLGRYLDQSLPPYPDLSADMATAQLIERLQAYCKENIDPDKIDRESLIPTNVVQGLSNMGVLGACLPKSCGGLALSQTQYCRLDRSGLKSFDPREHGVARYRFEPIWIHRLLVKMHNEQCRKAG